MKLNATSEMEALTQHGWSNVHPFQPADSVQGYHYIIDVPSHRNFLTGRNYPTISKQLPVSTKSLCNPIQEHRENLQDFV
jgi:glycine cleavage system protein P-like pyridoxal-binding family